MKIFERVLFLLENYHVKRPWLAEKLGVKKSTFNTWFNPEKQHNLVPYFYDMLKIWPQVSRNWLFFGEGNMLDDGAPTARERELAAENSRLKAALEEEQAINRRLVNKMLLQDADPADTEPGKTAK